MQWVMTKTWSRDKNMTRSVVRVLEQTIKKILRGDYI